MIIEITLDEVYSLYIKKQQRGFYCISAKNLMSFSDFIKNELLNVVRRNYSYSLIDKIKII